MHTLCSQYGLAGTSGATIPSPTGEPLAVTREDIAALIDRSAAWVGHALTAWKRLNNAAIMEIPKNAEVKEAFARYNNLQEATSNDIKEKYGIQSFVVAK